MQKTIDKYVGVLCEARKKKGLTEQQARDNLQDINVYGTLMVLAGDADGMVSGATTTTANTIRPALQVCAAYHDCLRSRMACGRTSLDCLLASFVFWYCCMAAEVSHVCNWSCQVTTWWSGLNSHLNQDLHNQNSPPGLSHSRFDSIVQHVLALPFQP